MGEQAAWKQQQGAVMAEFRDNAYADVDGDGKSDAIVTNENATVVRKASYDPATNFGTFTGNVDWSGRPYYGSAQFGANPGFYEKNSYFADVTGDGRADAIVINQDNGIPNGIYVDPSSGSNFPQANQRLWLSGSHSGLPSPSGNGGNYFADVSGDGRADAVIFRDDGVSVATSTGSSFGTETKWSNVPFYGNHGTFVADVTGDGKADIIAVNTDHLTIRRSDGMTFLGNENWADNYYGLRTTAFADVNGDGKADAIAINPDGIYVRISTGNTFANTVKWTPDAFFGDLNTQFADVNGDKKADAIVSNAAGNGVTVRYSTGSSFGASHDWSQVPYNGAIVSIGKGIGEIG
jgi:hypothetical protein